MTTGEVSSPQEVVHACFTYWLLHGISRSQAGEMREELECHLRDALADGKTIATVVGPSVQSFAASWANEIYHPRHRLAILATIEAFLVGFCVLILMNHALNWQSSFPFTGMTLLIAFGIMGLTSIIMRPSLAFTSIHNLWKTGLYWISCLGFMGLVLFPHITGLDRQWIWFTWNWPLTLGLVFLTITITGISIRADPTHAKK
jgi:hypothetical protein